MDSVVVKSTPIIAARIHAKDNIVQTHSQGP